MQAVSRPWVSGKKTAAGTEALRRLTIKHCLITGGPRGIGRATALLAAQEGYAVSVVGLADHAADAALVVGEISGRGGKAAAFDADVSNPREIEEAFERAAIALGPPSAVVNAAGATYSSLVEDFAFDSLVRLMSVNLVGLMYCCREATRRMSTARGGCGGAIVNISSMSATIGGRAGASAYAASKGAVDVFTTGFAKEVATHGIRVNTVRPGVIDTAMTEKLRHNPEQRRTIEESIPMGRIGRPEEIAEAVLWLLSDKASLVTGAHLNAGGGGFLVGGRVR